MGESSGFSKKSKNKGHLSVHVCIQCVRTFLFLMVTLHNIFYVSLSFKNIFGNGINFDANNADYISKNLAQAS